MKIIVFIINAAVQLAAAGFGLIVLLLAMNGYGEQQATPSLLFYITLSFGSVIAVGFASSLTAKRLVESKSLGRVSASLIALGSFLIVGAAVLIGLFFGALLVAEILRAIKVEFHH